MVPVSNYDIVYLDNDDNGLLSVGDEFIIEGELARDLSLFILVWEPKGVMVYFPYDSPIQE